MGKKEQSFPLPILRNRKISSTACLVSIQVANSWTSHLHVLPSALELLWIITPVLCWAPEIGSNNRTPDIALTAPFRIYLMVMQPRMPAKSIDIWTYWTRSNNKIGTTVYLSIRPSIPSCGHTIGHLIFLLSFLGILLFRTRLHTWPRFLIGKLRVGVLRCTEMIDGFLIVPSSDTQKKSPQLKASLLQWFTVGGYDGWFLVQKSRPYIYIYTCIYIYII